MSEVMASNELLPEKGTEKARTRTPIAAGLAVRALDTGRILMLQRSDTGKWEFPGGHIDGGETPETAARREWQEEVGLPLPEQISASSDWNVGAELEQRHGWSSSNDKYVAFVQDVPSEDFFDLYDRDTSANPDGDYFEAVAWVHPRDMNNHNLRSELLMDLSEVQQALAKQLRLEEIDLNAEEEADLDAAWEALDAEEEASSNPLDPMHDYALSSAFDPNEPRDAKGQWAAGGAPKGEQKSAAAPAEGVEDEEAGKIFGAKELGLRVTRTGDRIDIYHPKIKECYRTLGVDADGKKFIRNEKFELNHDRQGSGFGTSVFAAQVKGAAAEGYSYIETKAARHGEDGKDRYNGYYTWPNIGYDAPLPDLLAARIHAILPSARSVLDVMDAGELDLGPEEAVDLRQKLTDLAKEAKSKEIADRLHKKAAKSSFVGKDWWLAYGVELPNARFDLSEGSRSRVALNDRLTGRASGG